MESLPLIRIKESKYFYLDRSETHMIMGLKLERFVHYYKKTNLNHSDLNRIYFHLSNIYYYYYYL